MKRKIMNIMILYLDNVVQMDTVEQKVEHMMNI